MSEIPKYINSTPNTLSASRNYGTIISKLITEEMYLKMILQYFSVQ